MQIFKRVLTLVLALILVCANLPWTAAATELTQVTEGVQSIETTQPDEGAQLTDKAVLLENSKEKEAAEKQLPAATDSASSMTPSTAPEGCVESVRFQAPVYQVGDPIPAVNQSTVNVDGGTVRKIHNFEGGDGEATFQPNTYYVLYLEIDAPEGLSYKSGYTDIDGNVSHYQYISDDGIELWIEYDFRLPDTEDLEIAGLPENIQAGEARVPAGILLDGNALISGARWVDETREPVESLTEGNNYYLELTLTAAEGYSFHSNPNVYSKVTDSYLKSENVDGNTALVFCAYSLKPEVGQIVIKITGFAPGEPVDQLGIEVSGNAVVDSFYIEDRDTWYEVREGVFELDKRYNIDMYFLAKEGYAFAADTQITIEGGVGIEEWDHRVHGFDSLNVSAGCDFRTDAGRVDLTVADIEPGMSVGDISYEITGNATVDKVAVFKNGANDPITSGIFEENAFYTVEFTIRPAKGYRFTAACYPYVNGSKDYHSDDDGSGSYVCVGLDYDFHTYALPGFYLDGMPDVIDVGAVPQLYIVADSKDAVVTGYRWVDSNKQPVTKFVNGKEYLLEVTVKSESSYVFTDKLEINADSYTLVSKKELVAYFNYKSLLPSTGCVTLNVTGVAPGAPVDGVHVAVTGKAGYGEHSIVYEENGAYFDAEGTFKNNRRYEVSVLLYSAAGYRFTEEDRPYVNDSQDYGWNIDKDGSWIRLYLYYDFRAPAVEEIYVKGLPEQSAMAAGKAKVPTLSVEEGQAQITDVRWVNTAKKTVTAFESGKDYYLQVTYKPLNGYVFRDYVYGDIDNQNGAYEIKSENQLVVWYYYSLKPEAGTIKLSVSGLAVGKTVANVKTTVNGKAANKSLQIYDMDDWSELTASNSFKSNKRYSISFRLTPASGYRFGENTRVLVNGKEISNFDFNAGNLYIYYKFVTYKQISTVALSIGKVAVGNQISGAKITAPKDASYTVKYTWCDITDDHNPATEDSKTATGKFASGHKYCVYFSIAAKAGYIFDDDLTVTLGGKKIDNLYGEGEFRVDGEQAYSFLKKITKVEFPKMAASIKKGDKLSSAVKLGEKSTYTMRAVWSGPSNNSSGKITVNANGTYMQFFEAEPKMGYEFDDKVTVYVNGKKYSKVMLSSEFVDAYKVFNIGVKEIKRIDLTVKKPEAGKKVSEVKLSGNTKAVIDYQYWRAGDKSDASDANTYVTTFKQGKYHFMTMRIKPDSGNAFANDLAIYINGAKANIVVMYNLGSYCQVAVSFGKLGNVKPMKAPTVKISQDAATGQQVLTWNANPDATGYEVYRATSKSGKYSLVGEVTDTAFLDKDNAVGKTRYYKVKAVDAGDSKKNSAYSKVVSKAAKCASPTGTDVQINEKTGQPVLTWNAVKSAKKYEILRATVASGKTSKYSKIGTATKTTYTDKTAKGGTEYSYQVRAIPSSSSYKSAAGAAVKVVAICAAPTVTVKLDAATGKPTLTWKKVDGAKSYKVYRSVAGKNNFKQLPVKSGVTYLDDTAAVNVSYIYKVQTIGKKDSLNSSMSDEIKVTCGLARPVLTVTANDEGKPVISWKAIEGAVTYKVLRSSKASDSMKSYTAQPYKAGLSYTDASVAGGKTYYYKVIAVGDGVESAATAYKKATGRCSKPTLTVETGTSGKPSLKWNKISGAKKYEIRYSTDGENFKKLTTTTKTSYTHGNAANGKQYTYQVCALGSKAAYNGNYSEKVSCKVTCSAPVLSISVDKATGQLNLTWKKVAGATGYAIYRTADGVSATKPIMVTAASYKDANVKPGVKYSYQVVTCGKDSSFNSVKSKAVSATATTLRPVIAVTINDAGKPVISWDAVEGAASYVVYRSTKANKSYKIHTAGKLDVKNCTYTDTTVSAGKTYYYKVIAITQNGTKSDYSAYMKATGKCAQPAVTVTVDNSTGKPVLTWAKVSGAKKYEIRYSTDSGATWAKKTVITNKTSYTHAAAASGATYTYQVRAVGAKSSYNSSYCDSMNVSLN